MEVKVKAFWDDVESVRSVSSDDVFGLFIEADSLSDLATKLVLTFTDLWSCSGKPRPPEVIFDVECIKEQTSFRSFNLNVQHVPQQLASDYLKEV